MYGYEMPQSSHTPNAILPPLPAGKSFRFMPTVAGRKARRDLERARLIPPGATVIDYNDVDTIADCTNVAELQYVRSLMNDHAAVSKACATTRKGLTEREIARREAEYNSHYSIAAAIDARIAALKEESTMSTPTIPASDAPQTTETRHADALQRLMDANAELSRENAVLRDRLRDAHAELRSAQQTTSATPVVCTPAIPHTVPDMAAHLTDLGIPHVCKGTFSVWVYEGLSDAITAQLGILGFKFSRKRAGWYFAPTT